MIYERRYKKLDVIGENGRGDKVGYVQVAPFKVRDTEYFGVFSYQKWAAWNTIALSDTIGLEFANHDVNKAIEFAVQMEQL